MAITYTKLRSGDWGLRSTVALRSGEQVQVTKKSGDIKTETVGNAVWKGNGVFLYAIAVRPRENARPARRVTYCEGWGADNPHTPVDGHCEQCAAMDGGF